MDYVALTFWAMLASWYVSDTRPAPWQFIGSCAILLWAFIEAHLGRNRAEQLRLAGDKLGGVCFLLETYRQSIAVVFATLAAVHEQSTDVLFDTPYIPSYLVEELRHHNVTWEALATALDREYNDDNSMWLKHVRASLAQGVRALERMSLRYEQAMAIWDSLPASYFPRGGLLAQGMASPCSTFI